MKAVMCHYAGCQRIINNGLYCSQHKAIMDKRKEEHDRQGWGKMTRAGNYQTPEWRKLSKQVIQEVGHCQCCGSSNRLQVHHIKPVRFYPELMLDRSNLVVLCDTCHRIETRREIRARVNR